MVNRWEWDLFTCPTGLMCFFLIYNSFIAGSLTVLLYTSVLCCTVRMNAVLCLFYWTSTDWLDNAKVAELCPLLCCTRPSWSSCLDWCLTCPSPSGSWKRATSNCTTISSYGWWTILSHFIIIIKTTSSCAVWRAVLLYDTDTVLCRAVRQVGSQAVAWSYPPWSLSLSSRMSVAER